MKQTNMNKKSGVGNLRLISGKGSAFLLFFSCVALAVMVLLVAYDVLLRNFFGSAMNGVSEYVSEWLMPATVLFALAYTEYKDEHIRVTLIEDAMPRGPEAALKFMGQLTVVAISAVLTWSSLQLAIDSFGIREAVPMGTDFLPVWPIKVAVFFGWVWLTVQTFSKLVGLLVHPPQEEPAGEVDTVVGCESVGDSRG
ncbi:TRAP transporter small permease subunit [Enteractinococcus helveticum]|uniref:Tripartite ATP-independent periplasmic transporters DctQ component domain-containing protein n=1 Tax=Enteractinococcus helveticum TaxID=1837282 RepID=A0A1B7LUK9_9MICC|nr:TRAP transporter small permease [Enteractinococcus helveticum]OAV51041.1 hypothetical protein A6F49_02740 [Enteractinococcus helveticum]